MNYKEIPKILNFIERRNFLVSLIPIENPEGEFLFLKEDYRKIDELFEILITRKKVIFNTTRFLTYLRDYLKAEFKNFFCYRGALYFSISPDGNFGICHKLNNNQQLRYSCSGCLRPSWREWEIVYADLRDLFWQKLFYLYHYYKSVNHREN